MHPQTVSFPCPACRRDVDLGERGLGSLFRNLTLERVVERYRQTINISAAIMCQFCKPPQLEATKGCTECKSSFCNECFKLYHPWGTQKAQHEPTPPTLTFRPKVRRLPSPLPRGILGGAEGWGHPAELPCARAGADVPGAQGGGDSLLQDLPAAGVPALPRAPHAHQPQDHPGAQRLPGPQGKDRGRGGVGMELGTDGVGGASPHLFLRRRSCRRASPTS